jgi:hypothetical protein
MPKRIIIVTLAIAISWLLVWLMWVRAQARSGSQIGVTFMGVTNNVAGLLSTSDKALAVFSVTNSTGSPFVDRGFYYVETSASMLTYCPLGSASTLPPHGCGTILTRIPTNAASWRVIVPYSRTTLSSQFVGRVRDLLDRALKRPGFDFDRYGNGAPRSDWVKP